MNDIHFGPGVSLEVRSRAALSLLSHRQREIVKSHPDALVHQLRYPPLQPVGEGRWMFWIPERSAA